MTVTVYHISISHLWKTIMMELLYNLLKLEFITKLAWTLSALTVSKSLDLSHYFMFSPNYE